MLLLPAEAPLGSYSLESPVFQVQGPSVGAVTILAPQLGVEIGSLSSPFRNRDVVLPAALGTCLTFCVLPHGGPLVLCHSVWSTPICRYTSSLYPLPLCLGRGTCSEVHLVRAVTGSAFPGPATAVYCSGVFRNGSPEYSFVVFGRRGLMTASVSSHASLCDFVRVS